MHLGRTGVRQRRHRQSLSRSPTQQAGAATEVYVDVSAPGAAPALGPASSPGQTLAEQGLDERYGGLYCSRDEKMVLGLCGGLAHKFGIQLGVVRAVVFLGMMFVLWIPYLVAFFLPKLPTKNVPHPA